MTANYIITVFYQDQKVRNWNETDLLTATKRAETFKGDRFVRKVELSVILHVWDTKR